MTITVAQGDCVEVLRARVGPLFDACVTDPPYHLTSIVKRFGKEGSAEAQFGTDGAFARASRGFMGKEWDGGDVAFRPETWRAVFDQLKPGAHLVAFSGTRTYHRMACAIEDAGFEIRDQLAWIYGSGFPKSHNVEKGGGGAEWAGWGTALKPAWEPICLARKPLIGTVAANVLAHGTGGINIDACRIGEETIVVDRTAMLAHGGANGRPWHDGHERSQTQHVGRFPANILHDDSDEVRAGFPAAGGGDSRAYGNGTRPGGFGGVGEVGGDDQPCGALYNDSGSAARFFYSAKAGPLDRLGTEHPTVKPVDVMRWVARLVTRPGGLILDPFAGSGTTGIAALAEGFSCEMIDLEADHVADIETKLAHLRGEGARIVERHLKRKAARAKAASGGLFD